MGNQHWNRIPQRQAKLGRGLAPSWFYAAGNSDISRCGRLGGRRRSKLLIPKEPEESKITKIAKY
jgi:hypothetical protein